MRKATAVILTVLLGLLGVGLGTTPAGAAPAGWASFTPLAGSSRDFTTTMQQQPDGFPAASVQSDSVGGSAVGVQSGTSAFLPPQTPVGAKYGSSQGEAYLSLRPNGLNAGPPSTTTYTFARPTPSSGWTFVLGDIDADQVTVSAIDADGQPVSTAELGFQGVFNYCAPGVSPKPACGPPNNDGTDLPVWLPGTATLQGNTLAADSAGASGWFEPNVPLTSLTFTYARRAGSPVFQTWFSALAFALSGSVTAPAGQADGLTLRLFDPEGNLVDTTTTDSGGDYAFPNLATYDGYRVELVRPTGFTSDDPLSQVVDLSAADQEADFTLRAIVPVPAGGQVTDAGSGDPIAGVTVTVTGPGGFTAATTTDSDGNYLVDDLPAGPGYTATLTVPDDYTAATTSLTFAVPPDSEEPITGLDFELAAVVTGSIAGTVTDFGRGDPVGNVAITVAGGGEEFTVRTGSDGTYALADLPPGTYTVTVTPPPGGTVAGPASRTVTITAAGEDVDDQDFAIALAVPPSTYAISGSVTRPDGTPEPGVTVLLELPDGGVPLELVTDDDGAYAATDLPAGEGYRATVVPPDGLESVGEESLAFTIDDEDVDGLDFVLDAIGPAPPTTTETATITPPATPSPTAAPAPARDPLADTGGPSLAWTLLGGAALVTGVGLVGRRSRYRRDAARTS